MDVGGNLEIQKDHRFGDVLESIWIRLKLKDRICAELSSLLLLLFVLIDPPDTFRHRDVSMRLLTRGRHLRELLPGYAEQQRTELVTYCPLLADLQSLVAAYAKPTPADMCATKFYTDTGKEERKEGWATESEAGR
jgi:hypothetical protein